MRVPTFLLLGMATAFLGAAQSHAAVTIETALLTGSATAGIDSDDFTLSSFGDHFENAIATDENGLAGDALASAVLITSLVSQAGGEDTTLTLQTDILVAAIGPDANGDPFSATASLSAIVTFTLDADHWLTVDSDRYLNSLRRLSDNQTVDLATATQLESGSYELTTTETLSQTDSSAQLSGIIDLRLFTVPEPTSAALIGATLISLVFSRRSPLTSSGRGGGADARRS